MLPYHFIKVLKNEKPLSVGIPFKMMDLMRSSKHNDFILNYIKSNQKNIFIPAKNEQSCSTIFSKQATENLYGRSRFQKFDILNTHFNFSKFEHYYHPEQQNYKGGYFTYPVVKSKNRKVYGQLFNHKTIFIWDIAKKIE